MSNPGQTCRKHPGEPLLETKLLHPFASRNRKGPWHDVSEAPSKHLGQLLIRMLVKSGQWV